MEVQWYPGHMTKTKRMLQENLKLVDIVIELLDARIPYSSKNPDIDELAKNKKRIAVLNKADLSDENANTLWKKYYEQKGFTVVLANSVSGKGLDDVLAASQVLMKEKVDRMRAKGRLLTPTRAMVLGVPNVGKSTLINKYAGKAVAKVADKPGVTRNKQWIKIRADFELLDTPGILWPKFDDKKVGMNLAFTGAVNDDILDTVTLSYELLAAILRIKPQSLAQRYNIELTDDIQSHEALQAIGNARGFKIKGGETDLERTAVMVVDEFRGAKLGRISLELPEDYGV